jgi:hypothetical protein
MKALRAEGKPLHEIGNEMAVEFHLPGAQSRQARPGRPDPLDSLIEDWPRDASRCAERETRIVHKS